MKKYELSYEKSDEIVETVRKIILSRHPMVEDRMDILFSYPQPAMDINLNFYKNENGEVFTNILFCDGYENGKSSIPEKITINNLISIEVVNNLIYFILSDHDIIKNISKNENVIELSFVVDMRNDNMHGIECGEIKLLLNFYDYCDHEELLNYYLKEIVGNFYQKLENTESFKHEYKEYCLLTKEKFINSLSEDDLHMFVSLLSNKDLCNMLFNIPDERFMELCNDFQEQKNRGIKKLVK